MNFHLNNALLMNLDWRALGNKLLSIEGQDRNAAICHSKDKCSVCNVDFFRLRVAVGIGAACDLFFAQEFFFQIILYEVKCGTYLAGHKKHTQIQLQKQASGLEALKRDLCQHATLFHIPEPDVSERHRSQSLAHAVVMYIINFLTVGRFCHPHITQSEYVPDAD